MTPFDFWASAWRNADTLSRTAWRFGDMAKASQTVIDSRSRTIAAALQNPATADYAELGRMVPEKLLAFSQAGAAMMSDVVAWQMECFSQWHHLAGAMMTGRPLTVTQWERMAAGSMRMATRASAAGSKALAPIHKTATGNARRLKSGAARPR